MSMLYCSINGQQVNSISVYDRGLSYGDGIFTTAKIIKGEVIMLNQHINRLHQGCDHLSIVGFDQNELRNEMSRIALHYDLAVMKVIITAGQGGRGYSRIGTNKPSVIISVHEFPVQYPILSSVGITLGVSNQKLGINPMLKGLKHLNRLEQVLIRNELDLSDYDDLLVSNINEHIVECSSANFFWFEGEKLFTPDVSSSGVQGLMRDKILSCFPSTSIVKEKREVLEHASSMFICNSIIGIIPVKRFDNRDLPVNPIIDFRNTMT